jgi:uncharacterized integral membrane protein
VSLCEGNFAPSLFGFARAGARCDARTGGAFADPPLMNAQTFFRTVGFLIILFLAVYVSIENTQAIDFHFSLLAEKPLRMPAEILYFAMFAVGVVGGTLLHNSGGKSGGRGEGGGKKK